MSIKVTMFSVGLGAAILLEFRHGDRLVRVLADGGDHRAGVDVADAVQALLAPATGGAGPPQPLDLVIGTHYDEDHLDGLTELVRRGTAIPVREIWLPPVADDTLDGAAGRDPRPEDELASRFEGETGQSNYRSYLEAKRTRLERLDRIEATLEIESEDVPPATEGEHQEEPREDDEALGLSGLRALRTRARRRAGRRGLEHLPGADVLSSGPLERAARVVDELSQMIDDPMHVLRWLAWRRTPSPMLAMAISAVREATATDAINAGALLRLLTALGKRPEVHRTSLSCDDGMPLELGFDERSGRFDRRAVVGSGPLLTLLAPNCRLIAARRDRLPVGSLGLALDYASDRLTRLSSSNQLSYVARFDHDGQGVLVTGDSGFDGFAIGSDSARVYAPLLVKRLQKLSVIQVPHHGGICRHFYRVLDQAGFPWETELVHLLLSHEADSAVRPGSQFMDYVSRLGAEHPARLLFTAAPRADKASKLRKMAVAATVSPPLAKGTVTIEFADGKWQVTGHAVQL